VASIHSRGFRWQPTFVPFQSTPYISAQTRGTQSVFVVPFKQKFSSLFANYSCLLIDQLKTTFVQVKGSSGNHLPSHISESL
jgi:hypothetical protein